jgi:hypothetical protein
LFGLSTLTVLKGIAIEKRTVYIASLTAFLALFLVTNRLTHANGCEREMIRQLAASKEQTVRLNVPDGCGVMSWGPIDWSDNTKENGELLHYWGVTKDVKWYYTIDKPQ